MQLSELGISESDIVYDGKIHRFKTDPKDSKKSGWYIAFPDTHTIIYGDWREADRHVYKPGNGESHQLTSQERKQLQWARDERARRDKRRKERNRQRIEKLWDSLPVIAQHKYLADKQVQAQGLRQLGKRLVVPMKHGGYITGLQVIYPNNFKRYVKGSQPKAAYHKVGKPESHCDIVYIAEGYATASTINLLTSKAALVAFQANNLKSVAEQARHKMPHATIIIAADNDQWTDNNPGVSYANQAAESVNGQVVIPDFGDKLDNKPTDFNDLALALGNDEARRQLQNAEEPDWEQATTEAQSAWEEPIDIFSKFSPPELDLSLVPDALQAHCREHSELTGADTGIVAISSLVTCAAAIHDDIEVQPKRYDTSWTEQARLWGAVVGEPSTKKTPPMTKATSPARKLDYEWSKQSQEEYQQYKEELDEFEKNKKKDDGYPVGEPPERPPMRRFLVEDTTVEKLGDLLQDNERGLLVMQDELSGWFGQMDAYNSGAGGKDKAHWLQAYNGGPRNIDRIGRGSLHVPNFSVCVLGGIQPSAIRDLSQKLRSDGLLQRFMIICCRDARPDHDRPPDKEAINQYKEIVRALTETQPGQSVVQLSEDAHLEREALQQYAQRVIPAIESEHVASWAGKWDGLFARLALTYHCIDCAAAGRHPANYYISQSNAEKARLLISQYLLPHALYFYADLLEVKGADQESKRMAELVLSEDLDYISIRECRRRTRLARQKRDWEIRQLMQILEAVNWIAPDNSTGGFKGEVTGWFVNPRVRDKFWQEKEELARKREQRRQVVHDLSGRFKG